MPACYIAHVSSNVKQFLTLDVKFQMTRRTVGMGLNEFMGVNLSHGYFEGNEEMMSGHRFL